MSSSVIATCAQFRGRRIEDCDVNEMSRKYAYIRTSSPRAVTSLMTVCMFVGTSPTMKWLWKPIPSRGVLADLRDLARLTRDVALAPTYMRQIRRFVRVWAIEPREVIGDTHPDIQYCTRWCRASRSGRRYGRSSIRYRHSFGRVCYRRHRSATIHHRCYHAEVIPLIHIEITKVTHKGSLITSQASAD